MKKLSFLSAIVLLFAASSCNMKVSTTDDKSETEPAAETTAQQPKTAAVTDPVCGMDKDNTWTEYTATGTDTTWFCSPHCKETFAKNPEKYSKKEEPKKG